MNKKVFKRLKKFIKKTKILTFPFEKKESIAGIFYMFSLPCVLSSSNQFMCFAIVSVSPYMYVPVQFCVEDSVSFEPCINSGSHRCTTSSMA